MLELQCNDHPVDILDPVTHADTAIFKPIHQAWQNDDRIGSFKLWIAKRYSEPAILYQQRSTPVSWAPGSLNVTAGGNHSAGEGMEDGLREARQELAKDYELSSPVCLGKTVYTSDEAAARNWGKELTTFSTWRRTTCRHSRCSARGSWASTRSLSPSCCVDIAITVRVASHAECGSRHIRLPRRG